jgi:hypothetical protein
VYVEVEGVGAGGGDGSDSLEGTAMDSGMALVAAATCIATELDARRCRSRSRRTNSRKSSRVVFTPDDAAWEGPATIVEACGSAGVWHNSFDVAGWRANVSKIVRNKEARGYALGVEVTAPPVSG